MSIRKNNNDIANKNPTTLTEVIRAGKAADEPIDISEIAIIQGVEECLQRRREFEALDETTKAKKRKANYIRILRDYKDTIELNPYIQRQYEEEIEIVIKRIAEHKPVEQIVFPPSYRMMQGLMEVSNRRAKEKRKNGWVCGTLMARVNARFDNRIRRIFTQEELGGIIENIENNRELTNTQRNIILLLLHIVPETTVNPFCVFFDD